MNARNAESPVDSGEPLPDRVRNLLRYYIDCVREDEGQPVRAFLSDAGKRFIPWTLPSDPWHLDETEQTIVLGSSQFRFASELRNTGSAGSLLYGYPLRIEAKRHLIPVFTWQIEYELHGSRELWLHVAPEWPQMNPAYLKIFAKAAEEEREILESLGLLDYSGDPPDGLVNGILERMEQMGLLPDVQETLDPQDLARDQPHDRYQVAGLYNRAALFATGRPPYTRGLIRDLEEMVKTGAPGWKNTALGTMLGVQNDEDEDERSTVEVVPLNEEQRQAVRKATCSPLTAVTGPPGTGKSQIVVAMIADAYMRRRRVLFTSKNNKAVDVVESRVADLAQSPLMIRTGSRAGRRNIRQKLAQRLANLLAFRPERDDRRKYDALRAKYDGLRHQEGDLWAELRTIRLANSRLLKFHRDKISIKKDYAPHDWEELQKVKGRPDTDKLTEALQLADRHIAGSDIPIESLLHLRFVSDRLTEASQLTDRHADSWWNVPVDHFLQLSSVSNRLTEALQLADKQVGGADTLWGRFSLWRSTSRDRKQIKRMAIKSVEMCPALSPCLPGRPSFQALREWLLLSLSVTEKLDAVDRDRKRIQTIANEATAQCPALDPTPSEGWSLRNWRGWLSQAQSMTNMLEQINSDRKRIQTIATAAVAECSVLEKPAENPSFQAWRTWLSRALTVTEALTAIDAYRRGRSELGDMRTRDEVAGRLRRIRTELTESGAELVALYARLAPDRLDQSGRESIGSYRALQERLANEHLGGREYSRVRRDMASLFPEVSRHIPAWCVTNLSARSSLPLEPGLFDLLIIDEASQCDIASALPLLFRSRRAVIIGDPQQLRHITKINRLRDQKLQADHGLGADDPKDLIFAFSQNSLFDLVISRGSIGKVIHLQDHYRSHSQVVGFSNQHWYDNSLHVWTDYRRLKAPPDGRYGIRWTEVIGAATRPPGGSVYIAAEAEGIVGRVFDLLENQGFDGTLGVVTPFRAQANLILEVVNQRVDQDLLDQANFTVSTAHGFQGDERDIILFSPCVSRNLPDGPRRFLENNENLFNVSITRARSLLHVVGSRAACGDSGIPHIQRFASYCAEIERSSSSPYETTLASDERVGPWERPLYEALVAEGLRPIPQYPVNQYRLDLAIITDDIRIDVEADGESTHHDDRNDFERDTRLESLGWRVVRFWNHQIRDEVDNCVRTVLDLVQHKR